MSERGNKQWIRELIAEPPACDLAITDLRSFILTGLKSAFSKNKQIDSASIEDYTQESIQRIRKRIDTFRGDAKFTTWCMKIAVNLVISDLRKKRWNNISLDSLKMPERFLSRHTIKRGKLDPESQALTNDLIEKVNTIIATELTEKQRKAMTFIMLYDIPLQEVASKMGMGRGALYKLLHDARKKLKQGLISVGFDWNDIQAMM